MATEEPKATGKDVLIVWLFIVAACALIATPFAFYAGGFLAGLTSILTAAVAVFLAAMLGGLF